MRQELPATILVIFGITGDLSRRYLLPALAQVCAAGELSKDFKVLGVSRREVNPDELFTPQQALLKQHTSMLKMDPAAADGYQSLKQTVDELAQSLGEGTQVLFYLVVPPENVLLIIQHLSNVGLNQPHTKLLLEKPFGKDQNSAQELIDTIRERFPDDQVYRIDHYLAKEMAQNIVVFLGSNAIFRDVWTNQFIEQIEIINTEEIGIEGRKFYDQTGALRDVVQSHMLQLAALVLMEPCSDIFDFDEIPMRRLAALKQLRLADQPAPVLAQYDGYRKEVGYPDSTTETFVALTLVSNDPRWQGVPIRLTTGKKLDKKLTEVRIQFKKTSNSAANTLCLRIQPNESIELDLWVKKPGYERELQKLPLNFVYDQHFDRLPDAYEQVLIDAMRSNRSLFASSDEVLRSWAIVDPILKNPPTLTTYKPGSTIEEVLKPAF